MSLLTRVQIAVPDRYRIDGEIGRGGMSVIFSATDLTLDCPVAVKVLKPELATAEGAGRFLREARTLANLKHPNVISVHEVGEWGGLYYFVMDLVSGQSLASRLEKGPMIEERVREIGLELLDALTMVHDAQVVHRDIKPGNILLVHGHPVLADFGIARVAGSTDDPLTREGQTPGTPEYMAPEVLTGGKATPRSDLYALGAVLYECATGRRWNRAEPGAWKGVPGRLVPVLKKALADRPEDRWTDANSFREALRGRPGIRLRPWILPSAAAAAVAIGLSLLPEAPSNVPVGPAKVLVAPFEDLSGSSSLGHIADGLNAEITTVVGHSTRLAPIGRLTARSLQGEALDPGALRNEYDVDYILTASVQGDTADLRVSLALLSTADFTEVWSDTFEFRHDEHLDRQQDIAWAVLIELEEQVQGERPAPIRRHRTDDPLAWEAYQTGRAAWEERRGPVVARIALPAFRRAIEIDSTYALAWAGLADVYNVLGSYDYGAMPPRQAFDLAGNAAETAIRLQPELAEGWTAMANTIFNRDWNLDRAEEAFLEALARSAQYPSAHQWYSILLRVRGDSDAAIARARLAVSVDRRSPIVRTQLARLHYFDQDYALSAREYRAAIELDPAFTPAQMGLGHSLVMMDSIPQGMVHLREALRLTDNQAPLGWGLVGYARGRAGDSEGAAEVLALLESVQGTYVPPEHIALVHLGLGEHDEAVELLEAAWRAGSNVVLFYHFEPLVEVLAGHPRFEALLDSIGVVAQL
jgi:serine/threonine-protein kinase